MTSAPPLDLDALSLDELKKLVVQLLRRVTVLEEENQRLRAEVTRLKGLPKRPKLAPGSLDQAQMGLSGIPCLAGRVDYQAVIAFANRSPKMTAI